mmetsp:Transcript_24684/g.51296  ORF Transcript_24684/g.51296 Transcript_24684/m.51296 type:complete len:321 (+) Transcript_24684:154-1116(+)
MARPQDLDRPKGLVPYLNPQKLLLQGFADLSFVKESLPIVFTNARAPCNCTCPSDGFRLYMSSRGIQTLWTEDDRGQLPADFRSRPEALPLTPGSTGLTPRAVPASRPPGQSSAASAACEVHAPTCLQPGRSTLRCRLQGCQDRSAPHPRPRRGDQRGRQHCGCRDWSTSAAWKSSIPAQGQSARLWGSQSCRCRSCLRRRRRSYGGRRRYGRTAATSSAPTPAKRRQCGRRPASQWWSARGHAGSCRSSKQRAVLRTRRAVAAQESRLQHGAAALRAFEQARLRSRPCRWQAVGRSTLQKCGRRSRPRPRLRRCRSGRG